MDRRVFITSSLALGASAGIAGGGSAEAGARTSEDGQAGGGAPAGGERMYHELRRYELRQGPMVDRMHEYLKTVSIPALNRAGVATVGAFTPAFGALSPSIYLFLPHASIQSFAGLPARLDADAEFKKAAEAHASLPATDPAYLRDPQPADGRRHLHARAWRCRRRRRATSRASSSCGPTRATA